MKRWGRAAGLAVALVLVVVTVLIAGLLTLRDMRRQAEEARRDVAVVIAAQTDRVLGEAFFELEQVAVESFDFTAGRVLESPSLQPPGLSSMIFVVGVDASVIVTMGDSPVAAGSAGFPQIIESASAAEGRSVSEPFRSEVSGRVFTALGVPVFGSGGERLGTVVGFVDLVDPVVFDLVRSVMLLGPTGHADLVDSRGLVLVSTRPDHVLTEGDHPGFYQRAFAAGEPMVENVPHTRSGHDLDSSTFHVMAFAPVRLAPWGVAFGESDRDSYEAVGVVRVRLVTSGLASLAAFAVAAALVLRRKPDRPSNDSGSRD